MECLERWKYKSFVFISPTMLQLFLFFFQLIDTYGGGGGVENARLIPLLPWLSQSPTKQVSVETARVQLIIEQLIGPGTPSWLLNSISDIPKR